MATPVIATVRGLCAELSKICKVADRFPAACGEKLMLNVQLALTGRLWPWLQVDEKLKSEGFVPASEKPLMVSAALPVFLSVTTCCALDVPTV